MLKKITFLSAVLLSALSGQASAVTLNADGQWNAFDVDSSVSNSGGLEWIDLNNDALSFDFTLIKTTILEVVDGGYAGDRFNVFDNGLLIGQETPAEVTIINMTRAVNSYPSSLGLDFDQAFQDNNYSHGIFLLSAGNHSITGVLAESALDDLGNPINATVGAVRLISLSQVPLPAAAWLYIAGASLLGLVSRRRKSNI